MPKVKTNKSARKRLVRATNQGKFIMRKMSVAHRARFKSKRAKRLAGHNFTLTKGVTKRLRQLIGKNG